MAITEQVAPAQQNCSAGTTTTVAVNAGTGANRYLLAFAWFQESLPATLNGITYNGVALEKLVDTADSGEIWGLKNPASGSNNLVFTFSADPTTAEGASIGWQVLNGVFQGTLSADSVRTSAFHSAYSTHWDSGAMTAASGDYGVALGVDYQDSNHGNLYDLPGPLRLDFATGTGGGDTCGAIGTHAITTSSVRYGMGHLSPPHALAGNFVSGCAVVLKPAAVAASLAIPNRTLRNALRLR